MSEGQTALAARLDTVERETRALRRTLWLVLLMIGFAALASCQTRVVQPAPKAARYALTAAAKGMLFRLDTVTGEVQAFVVGREEDLRTVERFGTL